MRQAAPLVHSTPRGFKRGCRCDGCRQAFNERMKMLRAGYRKSVMGKIIHERDSQVSTPMQSCSCSLGGWDPPWQWSWDRAHSFTPFSEMSTWPSAVDENWKTWRQSSESRFGFRFGRREE